jgi:DNA mismatch repair protein MutS2
VRERERLAEKQARQEARRYLLDARKEIDSTLKELKQVAADAAGVAPSVLDERAREARRRAEELAARQQDHLGRLDREERNAERRGGRGERPLNAARAAAPAPLAVGDTVEVSTLGGKLGKLVEVRGKEGVVTVGALKMTVPLVTLAKSKQQMPKPEIVVSVMGDVPEVHASREIDLRGMRFDEIDDVLLPALDNAVRADLRSLRIIHGKGTGALRERVTELLRKDTRARSFRMGLWNEGGAGVTVVELE